MASVSLLRARSGPQLYLAFSATTGDAALRVLADGLTVVSLYIPSALPRGTTSLAL